MSATGFSLLGAATSQTEKLPAAGFFTREILDNRRA